MKTKDNIDKLINEALSAEEAVFYNELDEQGFPEMITGLFSGKLKWLTLLTTFFMLLIFAGGVYCAIQFFKSTELTKMLKWGVGIFASLMAVSMIKLMNWMQILTNSMSREIKRLELQIALLSNKLADK